MDRYIGRMLDNRYEILGVIGTGGMAVVYKARCHRLNRFVAIKILKDEYFQDEEFRRRFHAEGQAVAMLSHANIVQVYDVSTTAEADYIVMELIDGITLKQYMEKMGTLNWKETLHFGIQIAKALEHAHSRGIVHRDIKPHNIMVLKNGSVKVADFGIAQVMSKTSTLTKEALGSVHYISPEQAKGGRVDNRSDIYSLGVVMYEMITGRPPFDGETPVAVAIKHINGGAVAPSVWNPNLPKGLEQIIMKAMAHDVGSRYPSATRMLEDMEAFRQEPTMVFTGAAPARREGPRKNPPSTIAEKTAESQSSRPKERPRQVVPAPRTEKRKQKRQEDAQSRVATIAIVSCSMVAVLAIVIFLVILTSGSGVETPEAMVEVPNFLDKYYSSLPEYPGIQVVLEKERYDSTYEKNKIIEQTPDAGDMVVQGTKVHVTVSMGPEPLVKTMDNLIGVDVEQAQRFLDGQELSLHYIIRDENSEDILPGLVTRTNPEEGTPLEQGQTISIWVSIGPSVVLKRMPNVLGQSLSTARNVLTDNGFNNVETEVVESYEREGTVVGQSVGRYESVDVNTVIILQVSNGATMPTTEPTTLPTVPSTVPTAPVTEPPEGMVTKEVTFRLPESTADYVLSIRQNGSPVGKDVQIIAGAKSITITLTAAGKQSYDIYINNEFVETQEVDFGTDGGQN